MALDNSTIQEPLPGNLQARVENALNNVTMAEAEYDRLSKLAALKKSELQNAHDALKYSESELKKVNKELENTNLELSKSSIKFNELQYSIKDANHELEEAAKQKKEFTDFIAGKEKALEDRTASISLQESQLSKRQALLEKSETEHRVKVAKLLEAIK